MDHGMGRWGVNYIYGTFLVLTGLKAIGEDMNQGYIQKAVNWLKIHQNNDGGWGESCKSYEDDEYNGGIENCRVFTRQFMAMFGLYEWGKLPSMPVEMMLLPNWFHFNIYEFSSWSRSVIVPLLIIFAKKPICHLPDSFSVDELYSSNGHSHSKSDGVIADYWKLFFEYFDKFFLKVLNMKIPKIDQLC